MSSSCYNFLVCFVVLVFIRSNIASPSLPRSHRDVSNAYHPSSTTDFDGSIKYISTEIENFLLNFTNNSEFIFRNLNAIVSNVLEEGFDNVATWMVDLVLRVEFLIMADGSHYIFPLDTNTGLEEEHRIVAISVSKLLMNLKTMERTDKLIKNVTRNVMVSEDLKAQFTELKSSPVKLLKFLQKYFEVLNHQFEIDDELTVEYKRGKVQAKEVVKRGPKMREPLRKRWVRPQEPVSMEELISFLKDKDVYRQACVNKMIFMRQAEKHFTMIFSSTHHKRYLLSKALISMAKSSNHESEINEIYYRALTLASGVDYIKASVWVLSDALFDSIERNLESVPTLQSEVWAVMKEVEKNTVYDIDMLHIDFSLL